MWLQSITQAVVKLTDWCTRCTGPGYVDVEMGSWMAKKSREQPTVYEVQGIEKSMRRNDRGWARHRRLDTTTKYI